ncbi:NAD(P)/FAD-dependent oxidoreductase [Streptomyces scabiei]|uniref:NAD(P)/FAD-dependent oxidoreductase n=1 Tax=Streptomyces scabiei TaxID=1930 RepID=UPI0029BD1658|nr:FAD-dependent oxidoreductase [Streptomyces scabiei]MDX3523663.1 FAD-dependent oxidoreductase [Streptomyces scabiei]
MGREDGAARRVLVVGCGMAGARFVSRLTALNPDVRITVLDGEHRPAYNRTLLTGVLAGHHRPGDIALPLPPGTDLRAGVRVVAVRRATRTVIDSTGTEHAYDVLVLATGSRPHHPWPRGRPATGGEHHLHTLADVRNLTADCAGARTPMVIGGGLLGVETALTLAARALPVTLVHRGPHLLHRHLDTKAGTLLRGVLEDAGITVRTGTPASGSTGGPGRRRVLLGDGTGEGDTVGADLVVVACGTRPRVALARAAGLPVRTGVVVDDTLASVGDPRVYALGDCAEHRGVVHDTAVPAWQQADVLAERLSGHDRHARFTGARALTRLIAGDVDLAVFGEAALGVGAGVGGGAGTDVLCVSDDRNRVYKKIVTRDDHVVGGILLGDLSTVDTVRRAYEATEPLPPDRLHLVSALGGDG